MGRKKRKVVEPPPAATMVGGVASPRRAMAMTTTMASMASHNVKMESGLPAVVVADHVFARPADPRAAAMAPSPPPTIATDPQGIKSSADDGSRAASSPSVHIKSATMTASNAEGEEAEDYLGSAKPASQYGLHSHAGDLVEEDVYVSDGSLDSDDDDDDVDDAEVGSEEGGGKEKKRATTEMVITTSKMGLMRRGGISSLLGAPQVNRTWVRPGDKDGAGDNGGDQSGVKKEEAEGDAAEEEENESLLDPAARLALQQRRIESAKAAARVMEASENAGRDPCLFSKRTAFDIRMDQIEEKPWDKADGAADPTDYFNYGMTEEDWLEYSERQLAVRQELTDASKQKRLPDPGIVLVVPRAPKVQGDRVAVRLKKKTPEEEAEEEPKKVRFKEDCPPSPVVSEDGGLEEDAANATPPAPPPPPPAWSTPQGSKSDGRAAAADDGISGVNSGVFSPDDDASGGTPDAGTPSKSNLVASGRAYLQRASPSPRKNGMSPHPRAQATDLLKKSAETRRLLRERLTPGYSGGVPHRPPGGGAAPTGRKPWTDNALGERSSDTFASRQGAACRAIGRTIRESGARLKLDGKWWEGADDASEPAVIEGVAQLESMVRGYCGGVEGTIGEQREKISELLAFCDHLEREVILERE
mmetsp:Transcript_10161/g.21982  ORF Transcript_10161/g.21982 Transcript_10161/m.21982 type:complete len:645 (-) Transcript_10161:237-2171(-)